MACQSTGVLETCCRKWRTIAVEIMRTRTRESPSWPGRQALRPDTLAQTDQTKRKTTCNGAGHTFPIVPLIEDLHRSRHLQADEGAADPVQDSRGDFGCGDHDRSPWPARRRPTAS